MRNRRHVDNTCTVKWCVNTVMVVWCFYYADFWEREWLMLWELLLRNQKAISCLDINNQITHFNPSLPQPMGSSDLGSKGALSTVTGDKNNRSYVTHQFKAVSPLSFFWFLQYSFVALFIHDHDALIQQIWDHTTKSPFMALKCLGCDSTLSFTEKYFLTRLLYTAKSSSSWKSSFGTTTTKNRTCICHLLKGQNTQPRKPSR